MFTSERPIDRTGEEEIRMGPGTLQPDKEDCDKTDQRRDYAVLNSGRTVLYVRCPQYMYMRTYEPFLRQGDGVTQCGDSKLYHFHQDPRNHQAATDATIIERLWEEWRQSVVWKFPIPNFATLGELVFLNNIYGRRDDRIPFWTIKHFMTSQCITNTPAQQMVSTMSLNLGFSDTPHSS